ncbi:PREDICTED: zinc finger protein 141-like [Amphimedon queenslandica]|uniref:C2H2-type domain-containing protein n=1 Tax=Amphimedon queenslandica TaxID=400682 RepID=A0A1X7T8V3_AMPQE|nr:PREDICTED: zinc finger protein 141-like [Amphimedon queenslandica]|eukprot:XP_003390938.1 PREDICTED: zinc finger protein 141-like [Amphimedon queenslandica]
MASMPSMANYHQPQPAIDRPVYPCPYCQRSFRRTGDLKRHKCNAGRSKGGGASGGGSGQAPPGPASFKCHICGRAFNRSGDLKRHKCDSVRSKTGLIPQAPIKCQKCRRTFRRSGDFKRHKCDSVRSKTGPSGNGGGTQRKKQTQNKIQ